MPAGTMVLLLFLLAVAPWEALPHPCWARASCACHFHCAQAEFSSAQLPGAFIYSQFLLHVPAPVGSGGVW